MWLLGQGRAVRRSHCFHATAESEYRDIRAAGLRGPVAIIPNGVDLGPGRAADASPDRRRRLLFLGRLHPVKGVDLLLGAWRQVQDRFPGWELVIAGPDENGYRAHLEECASQLGVRRVSFTGAVYGQEKVAAYRAGHLFVLPTHSENFGVAVAEALAQGLPAIVSKGAPWSGLESHGCGWWVEPGLAPLRDCLAEALALPAAQLAEKGARGRDWMRDEFSWELVGRMMYETYQWLIGGGVSPAWVWED
jgi:glycosyltransferase involved in cell wall biosynthesis